MTKKSVQLFLSFGLSFILAFAWMHTAHAQCDNGTGGDDDLECDTNDPDNVTTGGGDDQIVITENGNVADSVILGSGNDTAINNGTVGNVIFGGDDDDTLINNGSVNSLTGGPGNDSIVNNGDANFLRGGDDDDTITVQGGSSDVLVNGGDGTDQLRFQIRFRDEDEFDDAEGILNAVINSGVTNGTVTIDGTTFDFANIEELRNLLRFSGDVPVARTYTVDRRINREDIAAPIAGFCALSGGVEIWTINENNGVGDLVLRASRGQIGSALGLARATGQNQPVTFGGAGTSLWALSSGELQLVFRGGIPYNYVFSANRCGPVSIQTIPVQQQPVQPQTFVPQQQVVTVPQVVPQTQQTFPQTVQTVPNTFDTSTQTVSAVPQVPPGVSNSGQTHTVRAGENLFRISLRYGVSMDAVAAANGIFDINTIYAGQVLVIP